MSSSSVRRAFDRFVLKNTDEITIAECLAALAHLGYTSSILTEENIKNILQTHRDITMITVTTPNNPSSPTPGHVRSQHSYGSIFRRQPSQSNNAPHSINFEEFCVIYAYLSVLQQTLNENTCVSPIKGTSLQPPPIYLTNAPGMDTNRTPVVCYGNCH